jgi:hypothetical protein
MWMTIDAKAILELEGELPSESDLKATDWKCAKGFQGKDLLLGDRALNGLREWTNLLRGRGWQPRKQPKHENG